MDEHEVHLPDGAELPVGELPVPTDEGCWYPLDRVSARRAGRRATRDRDGSQPVPDRADG